MEEISLKMKTLRKSLKTKRKSLKNLLKEFSKTKTNLKSTLQTRYEEIVSKSGSGTFFFFGDSGTPNLPMQNLMKQMKKDYADTEAPQGIVLLGDNFYPVRRLLPCYSPAAVVDVLADLFRKGCLL